MASMRAITSGASLPSTCNAPRLLCSCDSFDGPVMTVMTVLPCGFFATQAMASCG